MRPGLLRHAPIAGAQPWLLLRLKPADGRSLLDDGERSRSRTPDAADEADGQQHLGAPRAVPTLSIMVALEDNNDFDVAPPDPAALVESLRAFGYTPETAISDFIDNSITARAKIVWVEFDWEGEASRIAIGDNGTGMSEAALIQAMRPGSTSPREKRAEGDLGRFGLGLKTASFSQCRHLTVITKTKPAGIHTRRWELDQIVSSNEWRLMRGHRDDCADLVERLGQQSQGTVVVWQQLDRVVAGADIDDEVGNHTGAVPRRPAQTTFAAKRPRLTLQ